MRSLAYFIVFLLICITGCKDFLQEENLSYLDEIDFYKTSEDAENALNAIYNLLDDQGAYGASYWRVKGLASDEGLYEGNFSDIATLANASYGSSNSEIKNVWSSFYAVTYVSNIVIEKVPSIEMDSARKVVVLAEAKFFRGLAYMELQRLFNKVPLMLDAPFSDSETYLMPQSNKASIQQQVVTDLEHAVTSLPLSSAWGRPNSYAAAALLSRMYFLNQDYAQAKTWAMLVINSTAYSLESDVNSLFKNLNDVNNETIFAITRSANNLGNINEDLLPPSLGGSGNYTIPSSFLTNFDTLDRRLEVFLTEEDDRYYVTKFWDEINESDGGTTSVDFPIIRFADILLMYAECENEINNGPTAEAYSAVNLVRARARQALVNEVLEVRDILPDLMGLNYDTFVEALHHERKIEFLWEGLRWADLVKKEGLIDAVSEAKPTAVPSARNYYFPIPIFEMELHLDWSQNAGY